MIRFLLWQPTLRFESYIISRSRESAIPWMLLPVIQQRIMKWALKYQSRKLMLKLLSLNNSSCPSAGATLIWSFAFSNCRLWTSFFNSVISFSSFFLSRMSWCFDWRSALSCTCRSEIDKLQVVEDGDKWGKVVEIEFPVGCTTLWTKWQDKFGGYRVLNLPRGIQIFFFVLHDFANQGQVSNIVFWNLGGCVLITHLW